MCNTPNNDSGGHVGYYTVKVPEPANLQQSYFAECEDIIAALNMSFVEGNLFKTLWRVCAHKNLGESKSGYSLKRDLEKVEYYARLVVRVGRQDQEPVKISTLNQGSLKEEVL